jgi:hypothetical protein
MDRLAVLIQVGGGTANQSATLFDGLTVNDTYGNIVAFVPSPDAVSEFRVQTNNNSAEYGRYTGGVINIASKSGSNEFHGTVYEYLRNRAVNAGDFFATQITALHMKHRRRNDGTLGAGMSATRQQTRHIWRSWFKYRHPCRYRHAKRFLGASIAVERPRTSS